MSDANEEIVKLQNRIAELEEDKGNLQLHLVDFDELKGKNKNFKTKYVFHPPAPLSCGCGAGVLASHENVALYITYHRQSKTKFISSLNPLVLYGFICKVSLTQSIFRFVFNVYFSPVTKFVSDVTCTQSAASSKL
jgi:hypothetical protein